MTLAAFAPARPSPLAVRQLARTEWVRQCRHPAVWLGLVATVVLMTVPAGDWSGGSYEQAPVALLPLALAALVAGAGAGRRDRGVPLAEAAPVERCERAIARLAGLSVPVVLAAIVALGLAVVSRIEGGYWIGEGPRRTDVALHSAAELIQLPLVVALAATCGLLAGRRGGMVVVAVACVVCLFTFGLWWMTNAPPLYTVTPVQVMPLGVDLEPGITMSDTDPSWLVDYPTDYRRVYQRRVVHQPTVIGHDVYLIGLIAVGAGTVVGGPRGTRLLGWGAVIGTAGVVYQLLVMPIGLT